ncbi:hypothetical protein LCGC14_2138830 [marine sediment metagenome]|uniref:Uncharacterized protein n=1 Tax=marine sediment metagenome TaxID=412755 RepID=A0A0F9GVA8_9ZZZZ
MSNTMWRVNITTCTNLAKVHKTMYYIVMANTPQKAIGLALASCESVFGEGEVLDIHLSRNKTSVVLLRKS